MQTPGMLSRDEKNIASAAHFLSLAGYFVGLGQFVAPLVIWLWKKDESIYIADQAKESLNFQITLFLISAVAALICVPLALIGIGVLLALVIFPLLFIGDIVLTIMAGMAASNGVLYRYPLCLRLIQ